MRVRPAVRLSSSSIWFLRALALILIVASPIGAQNPSHAAGDPAPPADRLWGQPPLAQDEGFTGFYQDVVKLRSTARLIATAAHPDDEDGAMLSMESRGLGATALELTINRGEGGQNRLGQELFDELGILRTLELLQADEDYGVEERFARVVDFGFSKNAAETFEKWGGHDTALSDMVRVIRTFRPDVLVSRFQGTPDDGHGNHQASGILTKEAFRAAGNPARFPDQIKEGLTPWQPKKCYVGFFRGVDDWSVRLDTGTYSPALGMSYAQLGGQGIAHQISQGAGQGRVPPGPRYTYYKLVDSVLPEGVKAGVREKDFFDGIDTSLPGLAARLGGEEKKVPFLSTALDKLDTAAKAASETTPDKLTQAAPILLTGVKVLHELIPQVESSGLGPATKAELLIHLRTKLAQFQKAAADAAAVTLLAAADTPGSAPQSPFFRLEQTFQMAVPGQTFSLTAHLYNRGQQALDQVHINLEVPPGWKAEQISSAPGHGAIVSNGEASAQFRVTVPADAQYTRPYFYHTDPQTESVYKILPQLAQYNTLPFPPPPVIAHAEYMIGDLAGDTRSVVQVKYLDTIYGQQSRPLSVGPPLSVELEPPGQVVATRLGGTTNVHVGVRNNVVGGAKATLRLDVPAGWRVEPASLPANFAADGDYSSFDFTVTPGPLREQHYEVKAVVDYASKQYTEGYRVVARHDIGAFYYYHPAILQVSAVDVAVPKNLHVGYVMGAGDDIPPVLKQLGIDLQIISPAELAGGDLSRYDTIVVGIRAYDVRNDVRQHNRRLLDYAQRGGTLLVLYNHDTNPFNAGHYTPYPATAVMSNRVTVEEAPVEVLAPGDRVFNYPNKITQKDFDGWVQERGLSFMTQWDEHYTPLLSSHDPGEAPLKGGLLVAKYGEGTYIYTGYAFFRQLPAGVPGAIRLFANLLSVGAKAAK